MAYEHNYQISSMISRIAALENRLEKRERLMSIWKYSEMLQHHERRISRCNQENGSKYHPIINMVNEKIAEMKHEFTESIDAVNELDQRVTELQHTHDKLKDSHKEMEDVLRRELVYKIRKRGVTKKLLAEYGKQLAFLN